MPTPPSLSVQVPCPIDPSHTVAESKLQAHVKKCTRFIALLQEKVRGLIGVLTRVSGYLPGGFIIIMILSGS